MYIKTIFGAPGCGKTTYLINTLENLLKEYNPDEIAYVSFTKKGAYEPIDRIKNKLNIDKKDLRYFKTLHSIAFSECGINKNQVMSWQNYKDFSKAINRNLLGFYTEDLISGDDKYLFAYFLIRNNEKAGNKYIENINKQDYLYITKNFEEYKKYYSMYDFTDMLEIYIKNNIQLNIKIAIIDEAQDLTPLQWKMCKVAFSKCEKLFIAGDDDQAIYEWNGADVRYFLSMKQQANETVILDKSYRLPNNILHKTNKISSFIKNRVQKEVYSENKIENNIFFYNSIDDINIDNFEGSFYMLSRNNYFLAKYKAKLHEEGKVFFTKDELSIDKKISSAIIAYTKMQKKEKTTDYENIILNKYIKDKNAINSLQWYDNMQIDFDTLSYYRNIIKNKKINETTSNIHVNTIHGVKGGEADNVVLMLDYTKAVKNNLEYNADSEIRCLYVALTRTKKNLHIVYSSSKNGYDDYINSTFNGGNK